MDTDSLTEEAYDAVLGEAEHFDHNLTLQFGVLSYSCKSEKEYLEKSLELINELRLEDDIFIEEEVFFGEAFNKQDFLNALKKIELNIHKVMSIPFSKRTSSGL